MLRVLFQYLTWILNPARWNTVTSYLSVSLFICHLGSVLIQLICKSAKYFLPSPFKGVTLSLSSLFTNDTNHLTIVGLFIENYGETFKCLAFQHHLTVGTEGTTYWADHSSCVTTSGQMQPLRKMIKQAEILFLLILLPLPLKNYSETCSVKNYISAFLFNAVCWIILQAIILGQWVSGFIYTV